MASIEKKVIQIIVDKLGVDEAEVTSEASFQNDLGADSLDTVELPREQRVKVIVPFYFLSAARRACSRRQRAAVFCFKEDFI
jgi:hypothetical protein